MFTTNRGLAVMGVAATIAFGASAQMSQQNQNLVGLADLLQRLGSGAPTGQPVAVGQVDGKKDEYTPGTGPEFAGKDVVPMSGNTSPSNHAAAVGKHFYGNLTSMSFGVPTVYMWFPMDWITVTMKSSIVNMGPPLPPPAGMKVINHSWAMNSNANFNNTTLRRADWLMHEHGVLMVAGTVNPPKTFEPLMAGSFNGITVGLANGNHTPGPVGGTTDGVGRIKPEIVAPSNLTSYATPIVSAAANLLHETAISQPRIAGIAEAGRPEVIKAALLAGATHRSGWSNGAPEYGPARGVTATPLDPHYGADLVNVDRAHWILGGGMQPGATDPEGAPSVTRAGWDYAPVFSGSSRFYRLDVPMHAEFVSVLATWNRVVDTNFIDYTIADFDLHLWRVKPNGQLESLVGNPGIPWFESGNVVSESAVDNVEHLYIRGLQPGKYMIELRRIDDGPAADVALAWFRATPAVPGDLNEDGTITGRDLGTLLMNWGSVHFAGDLNGDGKTNGSDLATLLVNWFAGW